ncbi:MAG: ATP-dependent Clp protease proteolytic subunit [Spirochaetes bacterium]|nr:ATP-dependent Clp protease proteolytic subunit [Spirochaetota bacterium]
MKKNTLTVLVIGAAAIACGALATALLRGAGKDGGLDYLVSSAEYLLESVYREGYFEKRIDYNDPVLNERKVFITTDLDEKHAQLAMKKLLYLDITGPKTPIDLYIDTSGGSGGMMLSCFIQSLGSPVNVYALDFCCSAGTLVLASATGTRYAFSTSSIIVHIVPSESCPEDDETYNPEAQERSINAHFWERVSALPPELYDIGKNRYYNFTAEQALEFGIIDEIIEITRDNT